MNRPKLPKYVTRTVYTAELEKYCDELEKQLKFVKNVQTPDYERVQKELWNYQKELWNCQKELQEYKKALCRACNVLESKEKELNSAHGYPDDSYVTKDVWKEWMLSGEEI